MQPPYFGCFDIGRKSTAKTFEECLQQYDGDLENFETIEDFIFFYHDEDSFDVTFDDEQFKLFYPEGEKHDIYIFIGESYDDTFMLRNGKEYYFGDFTDTLVPIVKEYRYDSEIRLADIIEEEFGHLSANYPHLFKKITVEEFQKLLDERDYPLIVCAK